MATDIDLKTVEVPSTTPKKDELFKAFDNTGFRWFHVKAILISGVGFFTDAYDLYTVGLISQMIAYARFPTHLNSKGAYGSLPTTQDLVVKGMALVGTLFGQLFFGTLGDRLGRKGPYGWTLIIMTVTTIGCAAATWGSQDVFIGVFAMWRFLLGIGIGGDYPLSAVIVSEYTPRHLRGAMMAAIFSMQGIGFMSAAIVAIIVTKCFESSIHDCLPGVACMPLDHVWRIIVGIGVIPAIATYYLRTRLPETPRFTALVDHDVKKAEADMVSVMNNTDEYKKREAEKHPHQDTCRPTFKEFRVFITQRPHWVWLLGTAGSWFFLDIAYYCQNLFTPKVVSDIGYNSSVKPGAGPGAIYDSVFNNVTGTAIVVAIGLVPGYYFTVALIERLGRKTIQFMGFIMMTILLVIVGVAYDHLRANAIWAFIALYALTFFFANFGPNTTTFIVPGECFPTRFRSTCHGISAAWGKAGAIVGVYGFGHINDELGTQLCLGLLSIPMAVGLLTTILIPETTGKTLEELTEEHMPSDSEEDV